MSDFIELGSWVIEGYPVCKYRFNKKEDQFEYYDRVVDRWWMINPYSQADMESKNERGFYLSIVVNLESETPRKFYPACEIAESIHNKYRWAGEVCKKCGHRNNVGFHVDDDTWLKVSFRFIDEETKKSEYYSLLCLTCFDKQAELKNIAYELIDVFPVTWHDWR